MNKSKWKRKFAYRDSRRWLKAHEPFYSALHGSPQKYGRMADLLREYPQMEAEYKQYKHQQAYYVTRGKNLDNVLEPPRSSRWRGMIAVREAKSITAHSMRRGHTALKLLRLMYWQRDGEEPLRLADAARKLDISFNRAATMHDGFMRLVEERYNLKRKEVW